ncbi:MAG: hypothetical protein QM757_42835 [Paludibaculum sp.]
MGGFDANDHVGELLREPGQFLGLHVLGVLLDDVSHHAEAGDVDEGEDFGFGAVDHREFEELEVAPAGAAGVGHGGDSGAEAEVVRADAVIAGPGVGNDGGGEDVGVDVDQAGGDDQAGDVDDFCGIGGGQIRGDGGDFAILDGDVHEGVDVVFRVDDATPFEQHVVPRLRPR